jgi:hypothetical protein
VTVPGRRMPVAYLKPGAKSCRGISDAPERIGRHFGERQPGVSPPAVGSCQRPSDSGKLHRPGRAHPAFIIRRSPWQTRLSFRIR